MISNQMIHHQIVGVQSNCSVKFFISFAAEIDFSENVSEDVFDNNISIYIRYRIRIVQIPFKCKSLKINFEREPEFSRKIILYKFATKIICTVSDLISYYRAYFPYGN